MHRFHPLLPCQALGQALVLSRQGRGDSVGCFGFYCPSTAPPLWIADQVRNDVDDAGASFSPSAPSVRHWDRLWFSLVKGEGILLVVLACSPSAPSVRHWDRLFDSSPIKGEEIVSVGVGLFYAPPCGYCLEASMTGPPILSAPVDSRLRGNDGVGVLVVSACCRPPCGFPPTRE